MQALEQRFLEQVVAGWSGQEIIFSTIESLTGLMFIGFADPDNLDWLAQGIMIMFGISLLVDGSYRLYRTIAATAPCDCAATQASQA